MANLITNQEYIEGQMINMCGIGLEADQSATLGGVIDWDNQSFGLTVDHAFHQRQSYVCSDSSDTDSDDDGIRFHLYDDGGMAYEITSGESQSSSTVAEETDQGSSFELECRPSQLSDPKMDWSLVESDHFGHGLNEILIPPDLRLTAKPSDSMIYPEKISDKAPVGTVLVSTRRGVMKARGIGENIESMKDVDDPSWIIQATSGTFCK